MAHFKFKIATKIQYFYSNKIELQNWFKKNNQPFGKYYITLIT